MTAPVSPDVTSAATNSQRAAEFMAEVRSHLNDLPATDLDDLLEGLGADLEERLADGGELDDPTAYAEELRQAAGLPPRDPHTPAQNPRPTLTERIASARSAVAAWFAATPSRRGFRDFLHSLAPVWWVARAVIVVTATLFVFGHPRVNGLPISEFAIALTLFAVIVSVQWGRGKWLPHTWLKVVYRIAHVTAVLLLFPVSLTVASSLTSPNINYEAFGPEYSPGMHVNGQEITNIFAYDCEGNPLDAVRLYDQDGNPVETRRVEEWDPDYVYAPEQWDEERQITLRLGLNKIAADADAWNVFPLTEAEHNNYTGEYSEYTRAEPRRSELPPLARDCSAAGTSTPSETDADADDGANVDADAAQGEATADPAAAKPTQGDSAQAEPAAESTAKSTADSTE